MRIVVITTVLVQIKLVTLAKMAVAVAVVVASALFCSGIVGWNDEGGRF